MFTVYDVSGTGSESVVILDDIHIDIMDYIVPASCTDTEFRKMWAEFEWENKVSVNTSISELREYLAHLLKSTNMRCLTPEKVIRKLDICHRQKNINKINKKISKNFMEKKRTSREKKIEKKE